jgi:hypothetical protein
MIPPRNGCHAATPPIFHNLRDFPDPPLAELLMKIEQFFEFYPL